MSVGPTGQETNVGGIANVKGVKECKKEIDQANAMSPSAPDLEQAANAYAASLIPLQATIGEAHTYYDLGNYKDDSFAKGKALHQTLMAQANAFNVAEEKFFNTLDEANDAQQQASLQHMEKEGKRDQIYYNLLVMIQARQLVNLLTQDNVDIAQVSAQINTFETIVDEMDKAQNNLNPTAWNAYLGSVADFRRSAKELYRRLRDKTPYTAIEKMRLGTPIAWATDGSPSNALRSYNEMVRWSNGLHNTMNLLKDDPNLARRSN